MSSKLMTSKALTLRVLAALLDYPCGELRAALPELADAVHRDSGLPRSRLAELDALMRWMRITDPYVVESRYVDTFDRGRATSLHLFEHVHGDSRERGPALVDLQQTYERAGLRLQGHELPDHLPVVLEFASTQPDRLAREFLSEMAHILNAIFSALLARQSPYAPVIAAVLELAGEKVQAVPVPAEPALDEAWAEPPAFDGCSTRGQARPDAPQPIHIVRKTPESPAAHGARA
jgi:nitrate reductase molybdenum cofactor assembly chaperone NarJ/NarW